MPSGLVLALDPGCTHSAWVLLDAERKLHGFAKEPNLKVLDWVLNAPYGELVIEFVRGMGQVVGKEVFDTCYWVGRFAEAATLSGEKMKPMGVHRSDVKLFLCGNLRAKDANIRGAIVDIYGGKETAIGKKAKPGPLFGVSSDVWSALAVGLTYQGGTAAFALPGF